MGLFPLVVIVTAVSKKNVALRTQNLRGKKIKTATQEINHESMSATTATTPQTLNLPDNALNAGASKISSALEKIAGKTMHGEIKAQKEIVCESTAALILKNAGRIP